jgi:hypothetical protein
MQQTAPQHTPFHPPNHSRVSRSAFPINVPPAQGFVSQNRPLRASTPSQTHNQPLRAPNLAKCHPHPPRPNANPEIPTNLSHENSQASSRSSQADETSCLIRVHPWPFVFLCVVTKTARSRSTRPTGANSHPFRSTKNRPSIPKTSLSECTICTTPPSSQRKSGNSAQSVPPDQIGFVSQSTTQRKSRKFSLSGRTILHNATLPSRSR